MWQKEFIEILGTITFCSGIAVVVSVPISIATAITLKVFDKVSQIFK